MNLSNSWYLKHHLSKTTNKKKLYEKMKGEKSPRILRYLPNDQFCLVSLFNGILTVEDYLIPNPSLKKNSSGVI